MVVPLVLGGIEIVRQAGPIRQGYAPIGGGTVLRLSDGQPVKMTHWERTQINSQGTGYLDPGFDELDYSQPLELLCIKPRAVERRGLELPMPPLGQVRPDVEPWAYAFVGDQRRETGIVIEGGIAHLTAVPGARSYRLCWLPRYEVFTSGLVSEFDESSGLYDWSFTAEQC